MHKINMKWINLKIRGDGWSPEGAASLSTICMIKAIARKIVIINPSLRDIIFIN